MTQLLERDYSADMRKAMASRGAALPDGSFPIADEADLRNAIQAFGRAGDPAAAKRHIIKRARALGLTKLLPDSWNLTEADLLAADADLAADPSSDGAQVALAESSQLLEAGDATGRVWDVLLIRAGTSGNRRHYPAPVLRQAAPLFEGLKAFADHPSRDEERNRPERSVRDVVGWFDGVHFDESQQGLRGKFHLLESADWLRQALKSAWDAGKRDLLGFSINAIGRQARRPHSDGSTLIEAIERAHSTDVVTTPGAGGRLLGVLESARRESEMGDQNTQATATAASPPFDAEAFKTSLLGEVKALILETVKPPAEPLSPEADAKLTELSETARVLAQLQGGDERLAELKARLATLEEAEKEASAKAALAERKQAVRDAVTAANLPKPHSERLLAKLLEAAERREIEAAEIEAEIGFVRETIREAGPPAVAWSGASIEVGDDPRDKFGKAVDGFFRNEDVDGVPRFRSMHHMDLAWRSQYSRRPIDPLSINGYAVMESLAGGRGWDSATVDLRESMTTGSWGEVFADALYKNMLREYNTPSKYMSWRPLVSEVETVPSFQTRHWIRTGGYANLGTVAEQATYPTLTSPTDEEITYVIQKRGGIEDITFEMLQDPTAASKIRMIPQKMARSAQRTLYTFVFNTLLASNPTMDFDSVALFDATHSNTDTSAGLSVGKLQAGRQKMRAQTAYNESSEVLGELNEPRFLLVPNELQGIADRLISRNEAYYAAIASSTDTDQALDPNLFRGRLEVVVVDIWTDENDWILVADPRSVNTIVLGFLGGREEPEMFVQDNPTVGSVFSADKVSYKIRHIYGGDVLDYRSFYRGQG